MTVEAIHAATIQVLLAVGGARLTTTRVAARAGVSVGTLYQYYPNKQALLLAILEEHLRTVEQVFSRAIKELEGCDLPTIGAGLANAWLHAKTADLQASRAIYGVSMEFDVSGLIEQGTRRLQQTIARLLTTASDGAPGDVEERAFMLIALLGGSTRAVMELGATPLDLACLRRELPHACSRYLRED